MNELLQKHGCANVFTVPEGLRELMSDITREVLRDQPPKIFDYIANYLSVLLITREHGILAVKILDDLCDCKPSVSEHLLQLGIETAQVEILSQIIKEEVESVEPVEGKEKVKETQIMKKILTKAALDEDMSAKVCQVARNAYRDYWYRKKLMEKSLSVQPNETWEIAAERTLALYKKTKPSFDELSRATEKIQAAYRGYYVRRNLLRHLKPKSKKKTGPKVDMPGPPQDVDASREIDLGPVIDVKVREDDVGALFDEAVGEKLGLHYDPTKTITHMADEGPVEDHESANRGQKKSRGALVKSGTEVTTGSRHARLSSQIEVPLEIHEPSMISESRPSHAPSQVPTASELHKISFSEVPPEIIIVDTEEAQEVPEEAGVESAPEVTEIKPASDREGAQEVPEDIPDRSEGSGESESVPTASVASSAPDTANTTDVEDAGEDVETAEEGE
ncbi:uncharacterized protein LOC115445941 [Manduca sexta]|uniref:RIIa domain-containing protein n=1 Tax=Manduca sexta TaxID=7130 RepID=A0A921ZAG4_MANSE|nr:uncharacterized protein LOC115445941 [Manduca sexta]KAG6453960.1 hypothetical protein O3G_MSEX008417 [Manduca sexta]